jgi:F0F1-type ATP synthase assembly protein I
MQEQLPEMVQRITRFSLIVLPVVAFLFIFFTDLLSALNLLMGGAISLLSFRTIVWAVRKFMGRQIAQPFIMGISILKITAIGIFLVALALLQLMRPVPFLAGFTLVLAIIIIQGIVAARKAS